MPPRLCLAILLLAAVPARAVVIRGHVTSALGEPLPGSRIQLISLSGGPRNAASTIAGPDGEYEILTDLGGRFLLLTAPSVTTPIYAPQIGTGFYGGRADLLIRDIVLDTSAITPQFSAQPTLLATPLPQLSTSTTQVAADQLLTEATPLAALTETPSAFLVQYGQVAAPATLYLRGAPVERISIDGVTAESLTFSPRTHQFNFATLTTSGLAAISAAPAIETTLAPNPLYLLDSESGVVSLAAPTGQTIHPAITYSGDAGNLSTTRNEAVVTATRLRADALASFARFNTDNDRPAEAAHLITAAANLGYHISSATSLRLTLRRDVTANPLSVPFAIFGVQPAGKEAAQNLYGAFTFETRTAGNWHNLLRYGIVRERSEVLSFSAPLTGVPVTITGANGYRVTGTATFPVTAPRQDYATNRDEYTYLTDYPIHHTDRTSLTALLTLRYQDERALAQQQAVQQGLSRTTLGRTHFSVAGSLQGELRHRLFAQVSGFIDHSDLLGLVGTPRLGITFVPVRPGSKIFRGTTLHANAGTGIREPTLSEQLSTSTPAIPHARTLDFSVDQAIVAEKLVLRATYFHNQFSHQAEFLARPLTLSGTLAYRTQGLESVLQYQPYPRLLLATCYTYLAALVEQSSATAAVNPSLPGTPIGALTALTGARPFHRPSSSGFLAIQYTGSVLSAALHGTYASRSDDSTNLSQNPDLLLPNHNLSPGYLSLDASAAYAISHSLTIYTQLNNLLNNRNITPIGYLSTPFQVRAGLRLHFGGE